MLFNTTLPMVGTIIILIIMVLFIVSAVMLFCIRWRYKGAAHIIRESEPGESSAFIQYVFDEYVNAYEKYGKDTNTPVIVSEAVGIKMRGTMAAERFVQHAGSLFVTLGLFGTFLGLSMSVGSLSELISGGTQDEWLNLMDTLGGGLMSSLSGMGVAFYTSLVGVACSILFTIIRAFWSPTAARELMEEELELWLDQDVAKTLHTEANKEELAMAQEIIAGMQEAGAAMKDTMVRTVGSMKNTMDAFSKTVSTFNEGVKGMTDLDYQMHGTIERLDVSVRSFKNSVDALTGIAKER